MQFLLLFLMGKGFLFKVTPTGGAMEEAMEAMEEAMETTQIF